ncbi:uncharacterized protein LOC106165459 [Lingula anatina]|uniref:Uncharacterized protein LOC106165459 n=1 Tax=Lingula anatina TaxID=7574 RepID=A0A1S3IMJ7_LINAN|nr:uncharacterized protein LOC106165459 [Lingula anatina]|eukprot:XP_013399121.1 uncharacterized protein LOC106165459 [Lingula anatina]
MAFPITLENRIKLQKNWETMCDDLVVRDVSPKLISRGILTQKDLNDVLKKKTRLEQTQKLLSLLLTKNNQHFEYFQECLNKDYGWLADKLSVTVVTREDREEFTASVQEQSSLPQHPVRFDGRRDEVEKITQAFLKGDQLVTVQASPGQGKTTLATVIGHTFVSTFGIRSVMADMGNVSTELDIVSSLLLALKSDADLDSGESNQGKLLTKACLEITQFGKKILIILDSCEFALGGNTRGFFKGLLHKLNTNCRNAYVLCTSRNTIFLPNTETHCHQLEPLSESASITLLQWYSPTLDREEGKIIGTKCGFMALLLHILGYLLEKGCKTTDLVKELECSKDIFEKVPEMRDVYACVNLTYKRLCSKEQTSYQLLSIFPTTFTADDAFALISKEFRDITPLETHGILRSLCSTSMIAYDNAREVYVMHSVIKDFAQKEILSGNKERFNLHFMNFMEPYLDGMISMKGLNYFEKERERLTKCVNIFNTLPSSSKQKLYSKIKELAVCLSDLHRYEHATLCFNALLGPPNKAEEVVNSAELAFVYSKMGILHLRAGDIPAATENLTKAIEVYESLSGEFSHVEYLTSVFNLWVIYMSNKNNSESSMLLMKCIEKAQNNDFLRSFVTLLMPKPEERVQDMDSVVGWCMDSYIKSVMPSTDSNESLHECMQSGTSDAQIEPMFETLNNIFVRDFTLEEIKLLKLNILKRASAVPKKMGGMGGENVKPGNVNLSEIGDTVTKMIQKGEVKKISEAVGPNSSLRIRDEECPISGNNSELDTSERAFVESVLTMTVLRQLAVAMSAQGHHVDALRMYQSVLQIDEEIFGESPRTARTQQCIGNQFLILGDTAGAIDMFRRAVSVVEKTLGENHEESAISNQLLAHALAAQGNHADALGVLQRTLHINEQVFGDSVHTAVTLHYMGQEKLYLGDKDGAVDILIKAIDMLEKTLGATHEDTAETISTLGCAFSAQGNHADALKTYQRALCILEEVTGEGPITASTLVLIGKEMLALGDADDAAKTLKEAVEMREKTLGEIHEDTACSMHELACAMSEQGNHEAAVSTFQKAVRIYEQVLGESANTATTLCALGHELKHIGNIKESLAIQQQALDIRLHLLNDHEDTLMSLETVAGLLDLNQKPSESAEIKNKASSMKERLLTAD